MLIGNIFNQDFRDFILALNNNNVDYILVGGFAVFFMVIQGLQETWISG